MIIATHDYNLILKLPGKIYRCENKKLFEVVRKWFKNINRNFEKWI